MQEISATMRITVRTVPVNNVLLSLLNVYMALNYTNQNVLCLCTYKDSPISVAKILAGTDFCLCIEYLHLPSQALDPIGKVAVSVWEHFST